MKIKLDENMPVTLVHRLKSAGHDVDTVPEENLAGQDDATIWKAVKHADRFFITQDLDFSDIRQFTPGIHPGILLVRLRDPGRIALTERVMAIFLSEDIENWRKCLVVATDHKIRMRRPGGLS